MFKKNILYIICILSVIICLQGCSNQIYSSQDTSNISNEIWCNPVYLPQDIVQTDMRMLNLPTRQQCVYKSSNEEQRIVVDINIGGEDIIHIDTTHNIEIKSKSYVAYCYNGEDYSFGGVSTAEASGLVRMTEGENVLEWTQGDAYCRLHGTYSLNELVMIAEALEVRLP